MKTTKSRDTKGKCSTCKTVVVWTGGAGRAVWMAHCPVCGTKLERTCAEPKGFTWVRQEPVFKIEATEATLQMVREEN